MKYLAALTIALQVRDLLAPHCHRIEIAGSIRRKKKFVKDIEIVAIPKPYDTGLFESGLAEVVNQWDLVKGELEYLGRPGVKACRYTQRILPAGIKLDLFFAKEKNWGYVLALRTGSLEYNKQVLIPAWRSQGYVGMAGYLRFNKRVQPVFEEKDLFNLLKIPYCPPEERNL